MPKKKKHSTGRKGICLLFAYLFKKYPSILEKHLSEHFNKVLIYSK